MGPRRPDTAAAAEAELVEKLRQGDESAFVALAGRHQATMLRLAAAFVPSTAVAEEVVQDTWMAVLRGLDGFAGRSSFKTWLLQILVNRAKSTGMGEARSLPIGDAGPVVDRPRFDAAGAWMSPPRHWVEESEDRLLATGLHDPRPPGPERMPGRPGGGEVV